VPVWWVHLAVARLIWFDFLFFICEYSYVISLPNEEKGSNLPPPPHLLFCHLW
jgi:hypothetical protein